MSQSTTWLHSQESSHASLAGLVAHLKTRGIFDELRAGVHIRQKTVKDSPQDKVQDILLALLAGTQRLVELNTRFAQQGALQQAAGRRRTAEQSVAQQTLDAASEANVAELQQVLTALLRRHGPVAQHPFPTEFLILDVDLTGLPAGKCAEGSVKGYFSQPRPRRGRQQARVLASQYDEIVLDALYPGNTLLVSELGQLVEQATQILDVQPEERRRTLIRVDGGGGSIGNLNALLTAGYAFAIKEYSARRASKLASSVSDWVPDTNHPERQIGWVTSESTDYQGPVRRLAVRSRTSQQRYQYAVLLFAHLTDADLLRLMGERPTSDAATIMRAYLHFYDQRGGGVESSFGQDKSGLGITKRTKKRFQAQRFLMLLGTLAHNLVVWSRRWLAQSSPEVAARLRHYGMKRILRDLYAIKGVLHFDAQGRLVAITLCAASSLSKLMLLALRHVLAPSSIDVILDKT